MASKVETATEADWSFLEDERFQQAIYRAATKMVSRFHDRYALPQLADSTDPQLMDAMQDASLWLSVRPELVERTLETGDFRSLAERIYVNALRRQAIKDQREDTHADSDYLEESFCQRYASYDIEPDDENVDAGLDLSSTYAPEDVRHLAAFCFDPELLPSWRNPFQRLAGPKEVDRKSKADPSHGNMDVARMVDARRAYTVGVSNAAGLTLMEQQALYLICLLDMTNKAAAQTVGTYRGKMDAALTNALEKMAHYMNTGQRAC